MRKLLILAAAMAGASMAQPPRPPMAAQYWWESKVAVNSLNLSEAQTKQLNAIQSAYVSRLMELRAAVNKAEGNLEEVFNQPTLDELKGDAAVDQYANARDNLTRALSQLSLKMRTVLTADQWQELVNRQSSRPGLRPGLGRGRRGTQPPPAAPNAPASKVGPTPSTSQK
jgi:Spy/CpxP family protein refolding chaperone